MNKEEFIKRVEAKVYFESEKAPISDILNQFFESNVCIPKGNKSHKNAELLHRWIEGAEIESRLSSCWCSVSSAHYFFDKEIRIKQFDIIYEWQFRFEDEQIIAVTKFMTDDEFLSKKEIHGIPANMYTKKQRQKGLENE